jgi:hypothetical protein
MREAEEEEEVFVRRQSIAILGEDIVGGNQEALPDAPKTKDGGRDLERSQRVEASREKEVKTEEELRVLAKETRREMKKQAVAESGLAERKKKRRSTSARSPDAAAAGAVRACPAATWQPAAGRKTAAPTAADRKTSATAAANARKVSQAGKQHELSVTDI